jgi:hypothetical protein
MKPLNIKAYFGKYTIPDLFLLSKRMAVRCTGNLNFTFVTTSLTDYVTAQGNWENAIIHGLDTAPGLRIIMEKFMGPVAVQVNFQAGHDKTKLQSSGGDLTSEGGTIGVFGKVVVDSSVAGEVTGTIVSTLQVEEKAMGVMVYLKNLKSQVAKAWFSSEKHIVIISNLDPGTEYELQFAWVGTDSTLNPCDPFNRYPQN